MDGSKISMNYVKHVRVRNHICQVEEVEATCERVFANEVLKIVIIIDSDMRVRALIKPSDYTNFRSLEHNKTAMEYCVEELFDKFTSVRSNVGSSEIKYALRKHSIIPIIGNNGELVAIAERSDERFLLLILACSKVAKHSLPLLRSEIIIRAT